MRYVIGSVLDPNVLGASVADHDAVIEAVSPRGDMVGKEEGLVDQLIELTHQTGTRLGVIGGASSPLMEEGGPRLYDVSEIPPEPRPEIETGMAMLEALRAAPTEVDWFYLSPPASFGAWTPAPETGPYCLSVAYAPAEWPWSYRLMIGAHDVILFSSAILRRRLALIAAGLALVAAASLHVQLGFSDPVLGGSATSAAYPLCLAAVALAAARTTTVPGARRTSTPSEPM